MITIDLERSFEQNDDGMYCTSMLASVCQDHTCFYDNDQLKAKIPTMVSINHPCQSFKTVSRSYSSLGAIKEAYKYEEVRRRIL